MVVVSSGVRCECCARKSRETEVLGRFVDVDRSYKNDEQFNATSEGLFSSLNFFGLIV